VTAVASGFSRTRGLLFTVVVDRSPPPLQTRPRTLYTTDPWPRRLLAIRVEKCADSGAMQCIGDEETL
jgi:hypothetical protein